MSNTKSEDGDVTPKSHTCAEISYMNSENIPVSSDLCVIGEMTDEYKEFLKANFAEFLDNFRHDSGTYFYIG